MKLSEKQKEIISIIRSKGIIKIRDDKKMSRQCRLGLIRHGFADYNDSYDSLILTDLGKSIDLDTYKYPKLPKNSPPIISKKNIIHCFLF